MSNETAIRVSGLGKRYRIWTHSRPTSLSDRIDNLTATMRHRALRTAAPPLREEVWALRDVSFEVGRGEVLGVLGPNGAGKSTLLSILSRITEPTEGSAEITGRVSSLLEVGTGFHPELSGADNVYLNGAILGMSRRETAAKFDQIVTFSGVEEFIDMPVKRYSTGMQVRLAFAVAAHLDPEILLLDEVLAVGDRSFQTKCLARIGEITAAGRTVLFVSHDVSSVARLCTRGLVLANGRVVYQGDVDGAISRYLSSKALGSADDEQVDHRGSGGVRIEAIAVSPTGGGETVHADRPVSIRVDLRSQPGADTRHLRLQLWIDSLVGGRLVLLSTDLDPHDPLEQIAPSGTSSVLCKLENLPLKPGLYVVAASLERPGGEVLDSVTEQARFVISPSDVFGTGVLPSEHQSGAVLVRHSWEVQNTAEIESVTTLRQEASV